MAGEAIQLSFDEQLHEAPPNAVARRSTQFAGLSAVQIAGGMLVLLVLIWGMWATRELLQLRQHRVVSVRLGELVNQFALVEARSGDEPDKVTARTRAFMAALDQALKARAQNGQVVLVGEAVVASSVEDITAAVAADLAKQVAMPVAQALPPRQPVAPVTSGVSSGSPDTAGVAQAMAGSFGAAGSQPSSPNGFGGLQGFGQQGAVNAGGSQGGGDGQY